MVIGAGLRSVWNGYGPAVDKVERESVTVINRDESEVKRKLTGQLLYDDIDRRTGLKMPNAGQKIELHRCDWISWIFRKTCIAQVQTDAEGRFELKYDHPKGMCSSGDTPFQIKLVERPHPFAAQKLLKGSDYSDRVTQIYHLTLPKYTSEATVELPPGYAAHPSKLTEANRPSTTEWQSPSYFLHVLKAASWELPKGLFVSAFQKCLKDRHVQRIYDSFGPKYPKLALTGDSLINFLLNGIGNVGFTKQDDYVLWEANWDNVQFKPGRENALPNVKVIAKLIIENEKEKYVLDSIRLQFQGEFERLIAATDDDIQWAIFLALTAFGLKGEAEGHLGEGHLLPLNLAIPFFKYIKPENPIYRAAAFAFGEVGFIDFLGANKNKTGLIFGENGSLSGSPVETTIQRNPGENQRGNLKKSLEDLIADAVKKSADWTKPLPEPLGEQDYFNHAIKIFYEEVLRSYYIEMVNKDRAAIAARWDEIYRLSEAINQHLPECPCITKRDSEPQDKDFSNLAEFLARSVLLTILRHSWRHLSQGPFADLASVSLGVRDKALDKDGHFSPYGNTSASDANVQLLVTRTLLNFSMNTFLDNAFGDIPDELVERFRRILPRFERYPNNIQRMIERMMSATKI